MLSIVECSCCNNKLDFSAPPSHEEIQNRGYYIWNGAYGDEEFYVTCPTCTGTSQAQIDEDNEWEHALAVSCTVLSSLSLTPATKDITIKKANPHPNDVFFTVNESA